MRTCVLTYICQRDEVLLGMKKVRFGAGFWNGFGGGIEKDESIEEAACRETAEECGVALSPDTLVKKAHIYFRFPEKPNFDHEVHVFVTNDWSGTPTESEEMRPEWHRLDSLPMELMWPSDRHWVPMVLQEGKMIRGEVHFAGSEKPFAIKDFKFEETSF